MNIFVLDHEPERAASMACDKHVVKMVTETAQLLCSALPPDVSPYRPTHLNHPCAIWTRTCTANFSWLVRYGLALAAEYTLRYRRVHAAELVIRVAHLRRDRVEFDFLGPTPFAQALPEDLRDPNAVTAYRAFYVHHKARFATWTSPAPVPAWWPHEMRLVRGRGRSVWQPST